MVTAPSMPVKRPADLGESEVPADEADLGVAGVDRPTCRRRELRPRRGTGCVHVVYLHLRVYARKYSNACIARNWS
jgi:hypothetical protein